MTSQLSKGQVDALRAHMTDAEITTFLFLDYATEHLTGSEPGIALVFGNADPAISEKRASHAAYLYKLGLLGKIVVSGKGRSRVSEADSMAAFLSEQDGIAASDIIVENRSMITRDNFTYSSNALKQGGHFAVPFKLFLVTCPWHICRVVRYALDCGGLFPNSKLVPAPHDKSCGAASWSKCTNCRALINTELTYALRDCASGAARPASRNFEHW